MSRAIKEAFVGMVIGTIVFVGIISIVVIAEEIGAYKNCQAFQDNTNNQTSYDFWGGCYVDTPEGLIEKKTFDKILSNKHKVELNSKEIVDKKETNNINPAVNI